MKRVAVLIGIVVGVVVVLFVVAALSARTVWKRAGSRPWPMELGTLEELPSRYPHREPSADALRLAALARPLGIDFTARKGQKDETKEAIGTFVNSEWEKGSVAIGEPPAAVAEFIAGHDAEIDAVAAHLAGGGDIAWAMDLDKGLDAQQPNLPPHMQLARLLVARALIRARAGDTGAWDDLHAAYLLDRSLYPRPELVSQMIALNIASMINAAAWKLPLPAPGWLAELHAVDHRRLLMRSVQSDTWVMWRYGREQGRQGPVSDTYMRMSLANLAGLQRESATEISRVTSCAFDGNAFSEAYMNAVPSWNVPAQVAIPNIGGMWSRMLRYEAEREATANALRVRAGAPIVASSRCGDGAWRYEGGRLAFTKDIPEPAKTAMPLLLQVVANDAAARDHELHVERR